MIRGIPDPVQRAVNSFLGEHKKGPVELSEFSSAAGGCINHGGKLSTTRGEYFLKWNSATSFPGMFAAEIKWLAILRRPGAIDVPQPLMSGESDNYQWIVMEYKNPAHRAQAYWEDLGLSLALLHRETREDFGLDHDNYIGSLPQSNTRHSSWVEFFIVRRLSPQLKMAVDNHHADAALCAAFERLYLKLSSLLPEEKPSLLHGDLWSGNLIVNEKGNPCLIDPAVYYGHREMELTFTTLFGGMDDAFYASYQKAFPLAPGFAERFDIYNLYPLMVHVNLFGGGYLHQVKSILKKLKV